MLNNDLYKLMNTPSMKTAMDIYSNSNIQSAIDLHNNPYITVAMRSIQTQRKLLQLTQNNLDPIDSAMQSLLEQQKIIQNLKISSSLFQEFQNNQILQSSIKHLSKLPVFDYPQLTQNINLISQLNYLNEISIHDVWAELPKINSSFNDANTQDDYIKKCIISSSNYKDLPVAVKTYLIATIMIIVMFYVQLEPNPTSNIINIFIGLYLAGLFSQKNN